MTEPTTSGLGAFDQKLARIVDTAETEAEEQSGLLLELVREVHTVKWILVWTLVIVPGALVALTIGIIASL
jgi:hypothetical protein